MEVSGWEIATAIGTCGAVVVAAFSWWIPRLPWFNPKLSIRVHNLIGSPQDTFRTREAYLASVPDGHARYFHIEVTNVHRDSKPATNVRVVMTRLQIKSTKTWHKYGFELPDGVPLIWQHEHATGANRTLGAPRVADLFCLSKHEREPEQGVIIFQLKFLPAGLQSEVLFPCTMEMTVQAHSDEVSSPPLNIKVEWDGRYSTEGITVTTVG